MISSFSVEGHEEDDSSPLRRVQSDDSIDLLEREDDADLDTEGWHRQFSHTELPPAIQRITPGLLHWRNTQTLNEPSPLRTNNRFAAISGVEPESAPCSRSINPGIPGSDPG